MAGGNIYLLIIILKSRKFESVVRVISRQTTYESGDPISWNGEEAVVLGTGLTRQEAKENAAEYFNQVSLIHGDGEWEFCTQIVDHKPGPSDEDSEEEPRPPTKRTRTK